MRGARPLLCTFGLLLLPGCVIWRAPRVALLQRIGEEAVATSYEPDRSLLWRGRSADVSVRADGGNEYTPVEVEVTAIGGATCRVVVTRSDPPPGVVGAWRVHDGSGKWLVTRVPQAFEFGLPLDVPPGGVLLLEFDPVAFTDGGAAEDGAMIEMAVRITTASGEEVIRPQMRLVIPSRRWKLQLAGH